MGQERVHHSDQEVRLKRDEGMWARGGPYQAGLGGHGRECALGSKCCGSCWRAFMESKWGGGWKAQPPGLRIGMVAEGREREETSFIIQPDLLIDWIWERGKEGSI